MNVLSDFFVPGLRVVFCGTAVGEQSAARGHYYAGRGNSFWSLLHDAGFTDSLLTPSDDSHLPEFGIGLTDLVKNLAQSHDRGLKFDVPSLADKLDKYQPGWIAFTSKEGGKVAARHEGVPAPGLGPQTWTLGGSRVFVLPSSSGANQRKDYDGRATRVEWWSELALSAGF